MMTILAESMAAEVAAELRFIFRMQLNDKIYLKYFGCNKTYLASTHIRSRVGESALISILTMSGVHEKSAHFGSIGRLKEMVASFIVPLPIRFGSVSQESVEMTIESLKITIKL